MVDQSVNLAHRSLFGVAGRHKVMWAQYEKRGIAQKELTIRRLNIAFVQTLLDLPGELLREMLDML